VALLGPQDEQSLYGRAADRAPFILAFAFRRIREWRGAWLPTLAAIPVAIVCGVLFYVLGDGAAVRATSATWFVWLAFLAVWLMRSGDAQHVQTE